jgi:type I restriction enzyme S subunit
MAAWETETLGSVADMATDKIRVSMLTTASYISTENMLPDRGGVEVAPKLPTSGNVNAFLPGDVLFSNIRTYFKKVWLAQRHGGASADVIVFRPRDRQRIDSQYLYYVLSSDAFIESTVTASKGTKMPRGDKDAMRRYVMPLPPLPVQQRIAGILSAYDELIENSQRRIRILEAMARALYREWFVHFRFPGHEHHPRIASPLGEIPQGWEVKTVEEIVKRIPVGKKYDQKTVSPTGAVPVFDQGKSGIIGYHDDQPGVAATENAPVIVFANHTCYQRLVHFPFSAIQNVLPFIPHPSVARNIYWLHWATDGLVVFNDYKGHWPEFAAQQLVVPSQEICQRFGEFAAPISRQTLKLERAIQNLRHTRDLLLPRLLSGQIDVEALPDPDSPFANSEFGSGLSP